MTSVEIPNSVTSIGDNAFYYCRRLNEITCLAFTPPLISSSTFGALNLNEIVLNVPEVSVPAYRQAQYWEDFTNIYPIPTDIEIVDGEEYTERMSYEFNSISYTRNFETTAWQALYLPYAMRFEDWADKAEVAYINNVHQWDDDGDGVIDRTVLEFISKRSGAIEPHTPYVIKPKQTGEVTFTTEEATLLAAPETDGFVDCMSTTTKYTIYGTYQEKADMYQNGYYVMYDGVFMQASGSSVTLPPFRTYLKIESRNGAGAVQNAPRRVSVMVDGIVDEESTGLFGVQASEEKAETGRYNLAGQKVGAGYKGIVVRNGKKMQIK